MDDNTQPRPAASRRALMRTAAWAVPTAVAASSSPALAVSPCQETYAGAVQFSSPSNYTRASTTSGSATVALAGAPVIVTPVAVSFVVTQPANTAGSALATTNLTTDTGRLRLQHLVQSESGADRGGQILTITFSRAVSDLTFDLGGFTRFATYNDTAFLDLPSGVTITSSTNGADVSGNGTAANPWNTNRENSSDGAYTAANTVSGVTLAGPLSTFSIRYYSLIPQSGPQQQALFVDNMSFRASC